MAADRIFISYSHKDQACCDAFLKHLRAVLGADDRLEIWSDSRIRASADWHREIQAALAERGRPAAAHR
jgi:DNA-binding transcriptional regulator/RsmH inhibitor MraZ